jgi:hypothetical protein
MTLSAAYEVDGHRDLLEGAKSGGLLVKCQTPTPFGDGVLTVLVPVTPPKPEPGTANLPLAGP